MEVTKHAKLRIKERCGFNKKATNRMVRKVLDDGIPHRETKGQLNKWVTSVYMKNTNSNNIRLYGDKAYIFCDEKLITVLQVPYRLTKNMKSMTKKG